MKADIETSRKRREFLSRTGIVVLGTLPVGAGITPRTVLAGGCGAGTIAKGFAGTAIATIGGAIFVGSPEVLSKLGGLALIGVGSKIVTDSGVTKSCVKPKLEELKDRIEKF